MSSQITHPCPGSGTQVARAMAAIGSMECFADQLPSVMDAARVTGHFQEEKGVMHRSSMSCGADTCGTAYSGERQMFQLTLICSIL